MAAINLPNLNLEAGYDEGDGGWGPGMNRNLRVLDALVNLRVVSMDQVEPPPTVSNGDAFIVAEGTYTGPWVGQDRKIAIWMIGVGEDIPDGEWVFVTPKETWRAWVIAEGEFYIFFEGDGWVSGYIPNEYLADIGDGTATTFVIDHGLDTRDVGVTVYSNTSPWDDIQVAVARPSTNQVEISGFATAPAVDGVRVFIRKLWNHVVL